MSAFLRRAWQALALLAIHLSLVQGVFVPFDNCLDSNVLTKQPLQLQWVPLFVDANFDTSSPNNLRITLYGNVSGQQFSGNYPPPSSPQWDNDDNDFGKIANIGASGAHYTTLFTSMNVLSYTAWDSSSRFCTHVTQGDCPLGPLFYTDAENPNDLHAFEIEHQFGSGYEFSTLATEFRLVSGDNAQQRLACIAINVTPDLGMSIGSMLTWLPAAILILKGIATMTAAIWSPWGSSDIFRWSSNYGRDEDLLRLVTPGFGDCLQYIQFVTLIGSLSLQYPGFFQPAVSKTAWSLLLFNQSWVTDGPGTDSLADGIYMVNATYGISAMRQLIGMTDSTDVWACMAIWLAVIAAIVIALTQIGFFSRWVHRALTDTREEDLRHKNIPFTLGNLIRLLFNFFILPIIALSLFQLVISPRSPDSVVACAALLLAIWIISAIWILRVIFSTRPRTHLFDDMPTVLLYGPLYNTYSDSAAPFAFIPILITFVRGIAFGAAQPSGTAQLILLAICEIILIVTLNGFRPFMGQTSMNAYHTFFAVARFITVILSITFIESLNVSESTRGWIGYTILLIHACVLVFGFFLNSAQTILEVILRSMGVASQSRGSILNWRMLKKREDRPQTSHEYRGSIGSGQDMMRDSEGHHRSMSASSQQLLNQAGNTPSSRHTSGLDNISNAGEVGDSPSMGYTYVPGANGQMTRSDGRKSGEETFYRPPRKRTMTNEMLGPVKERRSEDSRRHNVAASIARSGGADSPRPAFFRDRADSGAQSVRTDYAVREVDQYYRGPALKESQTRKLKTGPADPTGPAANAQTWASGVLAGVTGIFGRKKKEKEAGKGFEVVRSSRMPPEMQREIARQEELEMQEKNKPSEDEPYRDYYSPEMQQEEEQASAGAQRTSGLSEVDATRSPAEAPVLPDVLSSRSNEAFDFGFDSTNGQASTQDPRNDSATTRNIATQTSTRDPNHPGMRAEMPSRRPTRYEPPQLSSYDLGLGYLSHGANEDHDEAYLHRDEQGFDDSQIVTNRLSDQAPSLELPLADTGGDLDMPTFSRFASQRSARSQDTSFRWQNQPPLPTRGASDASNALYRADTVESFDANAQYVRRHDEIEEERPNSYFNSSYHRAGDSISRNSLGASAALQGSSAEIVPGSLQTDDGYLRRPS